MTVVEISTNTRVASPRGPAANTNASVLSNSSANLSTSLPAASSRKVTSTAEKGNIEISAPLSNKSLGKAGDGGSRKERPNEGRALPKTPTETVAAPVGIGKCRALYDYDEQGEAELSFKEGDIITILDKARSCVVLV